MTVTAGNSPSKQNLEDNKTDKKEVAKFCREFRDNLVDSLKEGNSNTEK
jgi:hypothetical protein